MNIGARNAAEKTYRIEQATDDATATIDDSVQDMVLRQCDDALQWHADRGNSGDNANVGTLRELKGAVERGDGIDAVRHALTLLSGKMHPTARDIIGEPAKNIVYNQCPKRAYKYEE